MTVFDRIKELADSQKVSLKKVSSDLKFGENYIYNLRYSKTPNADKLALIADYFNVSVDYLLGRDKNYKFLLNEKGYVFDEINKLIAKDKLNDNFELVQMIGMVQLIFKNLSTITETDERNSELSIFYVLLNKLRNLSYTISTKKIYGRIETNFSYSELVNDLYANIGEINSLLQDSIRDIKAKYYKEMNDEEVQ
ncbi:helix-turn-helix domain-containing protein [Lactococcus lactis]|uniref:helix-turn-helix domain-containing protein n=1 Tax=Lactococcus lactis TaxID=1358 RepID=UPI002880B0F9|nr:helix-turn-helix transcriptional regulator [Lactococcus lactis]